MDVLNELSKIEEELKNLPSGYISKKNILGKTRFYLQWSEDGKKKSKYIEKDAVETVMKKIERRKELEKKRKELLVLTSQKKSVVKKEQVAFKSNVVFGTFLKNFVRPVKKFKKRDLYLDLENYLFRCPFEKVLILYGLRRTGKTTLIRQAILNMDEERFSQTAFIQVDSRISLSDLNNDLKKLQEKGYRFIFIDEVTLLNDFIEGAALFSDVFASSGMKIVLSGTDSLGFLFSKDESLYDRSILLHTTFIPYREFEDVLGIKGVDNYIAFGGTMSLGGTYYNQTSVFSNEKGVDEYIDTAIAKNIQHSLENYQDGGHFRHLYSLYEKNELTSVINRVIEDANHRFAIDVLTRNFVSHDLGISARNLRTDRKHPNDVLDEINKEDFTTRLKEALEIKNQEEQTIPLSNVHVQEIKEYLFALDLIEDVEVRSLPVSSEKNFRTIFTQPGMRYCQAKEFIQSLLLDKEFQNLSLKERKTVEGRILDDIRGRMLEDIVLLETKIAFPEKEVFKLQFSIGEFDMVVFDEKTSSCEIYEVKHSEQQSKEQYRHLIDKKKLEDTSFRYGTIAKRVVLYRGVDATLENGIEYRNVEKYLKSLN